VTVQTPEEIQYPTFAEPRSKPPEQAPAESEGVDAEESKAAAERTSDAVALPGHLVVPENTKGWSYRRLFALYLKGASKIKISDPYVRQFFQARI
jgi:ATP-dependent Lon protease